MKKVSQYFGLLLIVYSLSSCMSLINTVLGVNECQYRGCDRYVSSDCSQNYCSVHCNTGGIPDDFDKKIDLSVRKQMGDYRQGEAMDKDFKYIIDTNIKQDSITYPYLIKRNLNGWDLYLKSVDAFDFNKSSLKGTIAYSTIKDSIESDNIFCKYTIRKEGVSDPQKNINIIEDSFITRYVPIENGDYRVYTVLTLHNMIEPIGFSEPSLRWQYRGLLSDEANEKERYILEIYRKSRIKTE